MPDYIRSSDSAAGKKAWGPTERDGGGWDVTAGTVFVRPSALAHLPGSFQIEPTLHGTWAMVSTAEAEDDEQKITASGRLFSAGVFVEASAFGCDSKVLERAVNRALQKAADAELDFLEITGVTVRHDSGLDYASVLARARTIRRGPHGGPADHGIHSTATQRGSRIPGSLDWPEGIDEGGRQ